MPAGIAGIAPARVRRRQQALRAVVADGPARDPGQGRKLSDHIGRLWRHRPFTGGLDIEVAIPVRLILLRRENALDEADQLSWIEWLRQVAVSAIFVAGIHV